MFSLKHFFVCTFWPQWNFSGIVMITVRKVFCTVISCQCCFILQTFHTIYQYHFAQHRYFLIWGGSATSSGSPSLVVSPDFSFILQVSNGLPSVAKISEKFSKDVKTSLILFFQLYFPLFKCITPWLVTYFLHIFHPTSNNPVSIFQKIRILIGACVGTLVFSPPPFFLLISSF